MIKRTTKTPAVNTTDIPAETIVEQTTETQPEAKSTVRRTTRTAAKTTAVKTPAAVKPGAKTPVRAAVKGAPRATVKKEAITPENTEPIVSEIVEIQTNDIPVPFEANQPVVTIEKIGKNNDIKSKLKAKLKAKKRKRKENSKKAP
ncbi:hypothetical protein [Flavobacterium sp. CGRL2]